MAGAVVPNLSLLHITSENCEDNAEQTSLIDFLNGKPAVVDFWSTFCIKCPEGLDKMNALAAQHPDIMFIALNIDDFEAAQQIISGKWENIHHFFITEDEKEIAMEELGLKKLPYYTIIAEDGIVIQTGTKKDIKFDELGSICGSSENSSGAQNISSDFNFTLDEDF
uniref:Thioredoxin domain-containing protein n=1 Tax=Fibrocapsa japonica TaxID=94617 RepID=A0A7S2UZB1_9STRA|mmetsp:Transcript_18655/g.27007  ORF Transcript_18655/g.27007 Transcript_18655/m.27007 type:complete len:167 (+) Transcript_18655:71-571(+)|eukprot:CAMPEP_0113944348 /NCGR_PEP_ID=MMETSP1339-20121228/33604_1 /TAXON_ID=94617 /ORGANISM="Fibrocapsa japonica" /LENGTH=166 /DNA_ID=CAMNT_0000949525 /DNA_START=51 /DNA_END=551 /DNA_ORIENTATION=+ /assembly_acc=CAM_ASM_000762